jgi:hypothetical protein
MSGMKAFRWLTLFLNAMFFALMLLWGLMDATGVRKLTKDITPFDELITIITLIAVVAMNAISLYIDHVLEKKP